MFIEIDSLGEDLDTRYVPLIDEVGRHEYFFRVDGKNIKADNDDNLRYWARAAKYGLPFFHRYIPDKSESYERPNLAPHQLQFIQIGTIPVDNTLYKYMDLESALLSLNSKNAKKTTLRFVEPTSWDDKYEGRFYNARYYRDPAKTIQIDQRYTPFLYACCFSTKQENEAAWILYSHNKIGLAARCVEFKLDRTKLLEQLDNSISLGLGGTLYFGLVTYKNKSDIDSLHLMMTKKSPRRNNYDYHKYFDHFTRESYLNLLLLKRVTFEHESEFRIFIVPHDWNKRVKARRKKNGEFVKKVKPQSILVDIDWLEVIEEVRIDKNCSSYEKGLLKEAIEDLIDRLIPSPRNAALKLKLQPKDFDPYEDESLKKSPLKITTN